jgi:hypothetical protein
MLHSTAMLEPWLLAAAVSAGGVAPRIEVYTMGPGEHLFERFGHAAICVIDDDRPARSRCYNYGTTDFGSPPAELGWQFLRGSARFWVSVASPARMLHQYVSHDRTLYRQRLILSPDEVGRVAARLAHDARTENRYYLYHHFDDNCSTRVRDILDLATGGRLDKARREPQGESYRELGKRALADDSWTGVLGDLFVGRRADTRPNRYQAMFLPDFLRAEIADAFAAPPELVYRRRGKPLGGDPPVTFPWFLLAAVAVALPVWVARRFGKPRLGFGLAGCVLGVLGAAVWLVAALSRVPELVNNEQLLVFVPFDVALVLREAPRAFYARLRIAELALVSAAAALGVLRQPLLAAVIVPALVCALAALSPASGARRARR